MALSNGTTTTQLSFPVVFSFLANSFNNFGGDDFTESFRAERPRNRTLHSFTPATLNALSSFYSACIESSRTSPRFHDESVRKWPALLAQRSASAALDLRKNNRFTDADKLETLVLELSSRTDDIVKQPHEALTTGTADLVTLPSATIFPGGKAESRGVHVTEVYAVLWFLLCAADTQVTTYSRHNSIHLEHDTPHLARNDSGVSLLPSLSLPPLPALLNPFDLLGALSRRSGPTGPITSQIQWDFQNSNSFRPPTKLTLPILPRNPTDVIAQRAREEWRDMWYSNQETQAPQRRLGVTVDRGPAIFEELPSSQSHHRPRHSIWSCFASNPSLSNQEFVPSWPATMSSDREPPPFLTLHPPETSNSALLSHFPHPLSSQQWESTVTSTSLYREFAAILVGVPGRLFKWRDANGIAQGQFVMKDDDGVRWEGVSPGAVRRFLPPILHTGSLVYRLRALTERDTPPFSSSHDVTSVSLIPWLRTRIDKVTAEVLLALRKYLSRSTHASRDFTAPLLALHHVALGLLPRVSHLCRLVEPILSRPVSSDTSTRGENRGENGILAHLYTSCLRAQALGSDDDVAECVEALEAGGGPWVRELLEWLEGRGESWMRVFETSQGDGIGLATNVLGSVSRSIEERMVDFVATLTNWERRQTSLVEDKAALLEIESRRAREKARQRDELARNDKDARKRALVEQKERWRSEVENFMSARATVAATLAVPEAQSASDHLREGLLEEARAEIEADHATRMRDVQRREALVDWKRRRLALEEARRGLLLADDRVVWGEMGADIQWVHEVHGIDLGELDAARTDEMRELLMPLDRNIEVATGTADTHQSPASAADMSNPDPLPSATSIKLNAAQPSAELRRSSIPLDVLVSEGDSGNEEQTSPMKNVVTPAGASASEQLTSGLHESKERLPKEGDLSDPVRHGSGVEAAIAEGSPVDHTSTGRNGVSSQNVPPLTFFNIPDLDATGQFSSKQRSLLPVELAVSLLVHRPLRARCRLLERSALEFILNLPDLGNTMDAARGLLLMGDGVVVGNFKDAVFGGVLAEARSAVGMDRVWPPRSVEMARRMIGVVERDGVDWEFDLDSQAEAGIEVVNSVNALNFMRLKLQVPSPLCNTLFDAPIMLKYSHLTSFLTRLLVADDAANRLATRRLRRDFRDESVLYSMRVFVKAFTAYVEHSVVNRNWGAFVGKVKEARKEVARAPDVGRLLSDEVADPEEEPTHLTDTQSQDDTDSQMLAGQDRLNPSSPPPRSILQLYKLHNTCLDLMLSGCMLEHRFAPLRKIVDAMLDSVVKAAWIVTGVSVNEVLDTGSAALEMVLDDWHNATRLFFSVVRKLVLRKGMAKDVEGRMMAELLDQLDFFEWYRNKDM
ncbi:hypothetical protein HDU93_002215 [Gonapodya sp. JEL0774]|nr:hypothetical protein HDU93_002215 [Gonapodya sp. JEL0774]